MREVERKFRVPEPFALPALTGVAARVEAAPVRELRAVYHDTADLRLIRWGITLRRREGGGDAGWHLKLPVDGDRAGARDEVGLPLSAGEVGEVPAELRDLVTAFVREAELVPVATVETRRTPYLLHDDRGEVAVELVDDNVAVSVRGELVSAFREIEAEIVGPSGAQLMPAVADLLMEQGAVPSTLSKAASALGPGAGEPADIPEPGPVDPTDPAAAAVAAHIAKQARRFLLQDLRVRRDLPDSVHQMRVAARRLRSGLKVFGPLLDPTWSAALRQELGWAAGELGRVRDTEVMLDRLVEHAEELPPADAELAIRVVRESLAAELASAREHALASLRSQRHQDLLVALVAAVQAPQLTELAEQPCAKVLPPLVEKAYRRLAKDVRRLHIDSLAEPWHETRIAGKKARYAAELVEPVFGEPAKELANALERVTDTLGDHQDCHVAQTELRSIASRSDISGRAGFALGLLYALEEERELSLRHDFTQLWPAVAQTHRTTVLI